MLDLPGRQFHVGVRVRDLEAAMGELTGALGLSWANVIERRQRVWTPTRGAEMVALRFTYSREGPQHVELLQGPPGSVWDGNDLPALHHVGVWVDDVAGETEHLAAAGWTVEGAELPPVQGYGAMSYVRSLAGLLVEPVSSRIAPAFDRWWTGGDLA